MTRNQRLEALEVGRSGKSAPEGSLAFSIVGVGASAGGLEALESFFHHLPDKSGLAFVGVQHFGPDA